MFDLEKSIAEWRRQMLAAGIKTPVPMEELEIHLREEIERQTKSGSNEMEAFKTAVQKIGPAHMIQNEFVKQMPKPRRKVFYLLCALSFLNSGLTGIWSIRDLMHSHEAFIRTCGFLALIGSLMCVSGTCIAGAAFYFGRRKSSR